MMNVSAAGGLSDNKREQPQERPLGPRIGAGQASGRADRSDPWGPAIAAERHDHDHRQRREENVLEHRIAQERHARVCSSS